MLWIYSNIFFEVCFSKYCHLCATHIHTHLHIPTAYIKGIRVTTTFPQTKQLDFQNFVLFEFRSSHLGAMSSPPRRSTLKRPSACLVETPEATEKEEKEEEKEEAKEEEAPKENKPAVKAKAKAKSKTKAKAKGKSKAGAKQQSQKPPAKKKEKNEKKTEEEPSKKEILNDKCAKWKAAVDDADAGQDDKDDDEEEGVEHRDRGKSRKFQKLKDAGSIPEHILAMFEHESKKQDKPRAYKSALINRLFKPDGKGGYEMCASDPWFQQQKELMHSKYGKDEQVGSPKDVFLFSVFHGNEMGLQSAIDKGSVQEWTQDGVLYCSFRQTKSGVKSAKVDKTCMGTGQVELQQNQWGALTKAFKTMSWSFANTDDLVPALASSSSSKQQKQLENIGLTDAMKDILTEAKTAQEKLYGTAMKMLNKCSSVDDKKKFKTTVMQLKDCSLKNDHVLTWHVPWPSINMYLKKDVHLAVLVLPWISNMPSFCFTCAGTSW